MKEIETKIINIDVEKLRIKLLQLNFKKVKQEDQINDIYDFNDRKLLANKGYARVRTVRDHLNNEDHYYMTVKKMVSQEKYKIMDEYEVEVLNPEESKNIFIALGLQLVHSIKKYRESYKYKETLVEIDINDIDYCPFPYIEIESTKEEELIEVVGLLGYKMEDTTSKTMNEILKDTNIPLKLY
ncbi:MAG: CYTH domain-containing protein [Clostridiaceae bacterium]|nr:CYTH domain-containing protein [Clostridiaceae bacterium]